MSGPQICKTCNAIRSAAYHAYLHALDLLRDGCGEDGCGCDLRMTDCCDVPRWTCQTGIVYDSAGDPDVIICRRDHGCEAERQEP